MDVQMQNLDRVDKKISPVVIDFLEDKGQGTEFHMQELQEFVSKRSNISPDSPSRILRDLRKRKIIDYEVISRSQSHYLFKGFINKTAKTSSQMLKEHGITEFTDYYKHSHWILFKADYWSRHDRVCYVTGRYATDLHHKHYNTLFNETDDDVVPVCREIHLLIEKIIKDNRVLRDQAHSVVRILWLGFKVVHKRDKSP